MSAKSAAARREKRELASRLRHTLRLLAQRSAADTGELGDNFYVIEREGAQALKELSRSGALLAPGCERFLRELAGSGGTLDMEAVEGFLGKENQLHGLSAPELDSLGGSLRAALVLLAGEEELLHFSLGSLYALADIDFGELSERFFSAAAYIEPRHYALQDEATRAALRKALSEQAERAGMSESDYAQRLTSEGDLERVLEEKGTKGLCFALVTELLSLLFSLLAALFAGSVFFTLLVFPAVRELVRAVTDRVFSALAQPHATYGMETGGKVPEGEPTAVVVSTLLPPAERAPELASRLEQLYLSNGRGNVTFVMLADLRASKKPLTPADALSAERACLAIGELNKRYGERFVLIIRERSYSPSEGEFIGRERKRGAIEELIGYICGAELPLMSSEGELSRLRGVKHLLALDSDTRLPIGALAELVGKAIHPLNAPVIENGRVVRGYGVLCPRIGLDLSSASLTPFSRVMSGSRGVTAYETPGGEFWQDVFGEGVFTGKGLINVDAFNRLLLGRLPAERVLSHDFLEGCVLRARFVGEVELSDALPSRMKGWLSRLHRWIRGDWQNAWALFSGKYIHLSKVSKYKLYSLLTGSLREVSAFGMVFASLFLPYTASMLLCALALFGVCAPMLISALWSLLSAGGGISAQRKYYSRVMSEVWSALSQAALALVMLPRRAIVTLDAVIRALYRMLISRKHLLEWQTAADSEHRGELLSELAPHLPALVLSLVLFVLSTSPLMRLMSIAFLLCPVLDILSSKGAREPVMSLSREQRERITADAQAMWRFFTDNCTRENNFLPPDNVQLAPVYALAARTSPTNIGLCLLSMLTARDLGFITTDELVTMTEQTIGTVERLEKWNGNLYNWYSTQTLEVLPPYFISSVDSGNFAVSLVTLKQGLEEYRAPYSLIERIERLIANTDLSPLYNARRRLFSIGIDVKSGKLSPNHYDLLMSEARAMSYFAVAMGQAPRRHFGALGRTLTRQGGYAGAVSWTGTMFEYLMPHLWLPLFEGTLCYESVRFALRCQRMRGLELKAPWGMSESAFYEFDDALSYSYKAHGVQKNALKRGLSRERVLSPYSTYLALPYIPASALKNLERLEALAGTGKYGLYEAIDLTPSRGAGEVRVCESFMAHHIGMSLISCGAVLQASPMNRRFLRDKRMAAARELLEEKVPSGAIVFEDTALPEPPERRRRHGSAARESASPSPLCAQCTVLTNGGLSVLATDTGVTASVLGGRDLTRFYEDPLSAPLGVSCNIAFAGESCPLCMEGEYGHSAKLSRDSVTWSLERRALKAEHTLTLAALSPCERRRLTLMPKSSGEARICFRLRPALMRREAWSAHPAFAALFITEKYMDKHNIALFSRREREGGLYCLAAGMSDESELELRDGVLTLSLGLISGKKTERTLLLCAASSETEAVSLLLSERASYLLGRQKNALTPFAPQTLEDALMSRILRRACFLPQRSREGLMPEHARESLERAGISTDKPLAVLTASDSSERLLEPFVRACMSMKLCFAAVQGVVIAPSGSGVTCALPVLESSSAAAAGALRAACIVLPSEPEEQAAHRSLPAACEPSDSGGTRLLPPAYERVIINDPPRPFSFVLANRTFGTLLSSGALGCTYALNSHENKLTAWKNDPERPNNGERLLITIDGVVYDLCSRSTLELSQTEAVYRARAAGVELEARVSVPERGMYKTVLVTCSREVSISYCVEPLLGQREEDARCTEAQRVSRGALATNPLRSHYGGCMLVTRRDGDCLVSFERPEVLSGASFCGGSDNCRTGFIGVTAQNTKSAEFRLCFSGSRQGAFALAELDHERQREISGAVISSGDRRLDALERVWLPAQIRAFRLYGRLGYQQCSGAYGFRDQLQDCIAALSFAPALALEQIARCCASQFEQGDVLHWWHELPHGRAGVRTRCGDDLLWLPVAAAEYVSKTGDRELLSTRIAYLSAPELGKNEQERYFVPDSSQVKGSVYEHCMRAFDRAYRTGSHSLILFGGGDWNDGMNAAGALGLGESVWTSMFYAYAVGLFLPFCTPSDAQRLSERADALKGAVDREAWDGRWYLRGFYDDGSRMGSRENEECEIDLLPQAFSVLCGMPDKQRVNTALSSALKRLVDYKSGVIKLLSPPFERDRRAGYISAYPAGVRENGGQYTHAAVWLALALLRAGRREECGGLISLLDPARHFDQCPLSFCSEPYLMPADISPSGKGGWSGYTGAAGWYFRLLAEYFAGM